MAAGRPSARRPSVGRPSAGRPSAGLLAACCAASGFVLLPLGVTVWNAAHAGAAVAAALLWRPLTGFLLLNTLRLIACAVLSTGLLGTALAWAVERTDLPGKRRWAILAVVPLAIPPFARQVLNKVSRRSRLVLFNMAMLMPLR